MNLEKILVKTLLIASLTGCGSGGSGNPEPPPTVNRAPVASLSPSTTSGEFPLSVTYNLTCSDPDGSNDLESSRFDAGNGEIFTGLPPSNRTIIYEEEGNYTASLTCTDKSGAQGQSTTTITVTSPQTPPPTQGLDQTVDLVNFVDIDYCATLENVSSATRTIFRNGNKIGEETITKSSCERLEDSEKGNYKFDLTAHNVTPHSIGIEVPNYNPKVNLSNLNLDMKDTVLEVQLTTPTDKNPEDNRVFYTSVESLDGKVNPILGSPLANTTPLTIENFQGSTGEYQIKLRFGSVDGGKGSATKSGNIVTENLPKISGKLQSNETDSGRPGLIKAYSLDGILLSEVKTDGSGNFSLELQNPVSGYFLQARFTKNDGSPDGYVRTREFNDGKDKTNLVIRAVPYDNLSKNGIAPKQFKTYMSEIQFGNIRKWDFIGETSNPFRGIEIVDVNPITGDFLTLEEQLFIKDVMLSNVSCYTGGMLTKNNTNVQIDTPTSNKHYTYDSSSGVITPNSGWIVVASESNLGAGGRARVDHYGRQINKVLIRILPANTNNVGAIAHEEGHGLLGADNPQTLGHTFAISYNKSIMNGEFLALKSPSEIDCKAGKLIYEKNYTVMDPEFPRYSGEPQERILGLEFGNFN